MDNEFQWIVLKEDKGSIILVSKTKMKNPGITPVGSFLTIEDDNSKFILRVDKSTQHATYSPSELIVDYDLDAFNPDRTCQNIIRAVRIKNLSVRSDGLIDFIRPQSKARKSTQEEVDSALGIDRKKHNGLDIFLTSIQYSENKILTDNEGEYLSTIIKDDVFYHQIMIAGKTGSGKTVAAKYLTQHFVEKIKGSVIAINVKDIDLLQMEQPTNETSSSINREWKSLNIDKHGIENTNVYYPANNDISEVKNINYEKCTPITLDVNKMDPMSLTGILQGITDKGAQILPNIFRYWQSEIKGRTFSEFIDYFSDARENERRFNVMNENGSTREVPMHSGTFESVVRVLEGASDFFDNHDAITLGPENVVGKSWFNVINVAGKKGIEFGSILLRDLLRQIVDYKTKNKIDIPVLILIDEVHLFYGSNTSKEALDDLDQICRIGRSQKIGVIFASQNPNDLPKGIESVVNTKMFFRSDEPKALKNYTLSTEDAMNLNPGYGYGTIYGLPGVRTFKMPMSTCGVIKKED